MSNYDILIKREGDSMAKKCTLCGGNLDSTKRCTFCGLDNTKNDDQYKGYLNRSHHEDVPLTHVHNEPSMHRYEYKNQEKSNAYDYTKKVTEQAKRFSEQYTNTVNQNKKTFDKKKKDGKSARILGIIIAVCGIISPLFGLLGEFSDGIADVFIGIEEEYSISEETPLSSTYETWLSSGLYEVGVHIPEGIYDVILEEGGYASVGIYELENDEFPLRESYSFSPTDEYYYQIEFQKGMIIGVSTHSTIYFHSLTNYDFEMDNVVNVDDAESYHVSGQMTAGLDFPAGVYDVYFVAASGNGEGNMTASVMNPSGTGEMWNYVLYFDENVGDYYYAQLILTPGSKICLDEGVKGVTIAPSYFISQELYDITWAQN